MSDDLQAKVTEYSVTESTERGTGFGASDETTSTVRCVIAGKDADRVARAMLAAALDSTARQGELPNNPHNPNTPRENP